ncbi:hypothetical protein BC829DRAFT_422567 [Chytridium lagenaria]|nr:hypothetical protein BC829DRAFT_422567 [Chytridium lagenaria]
MRLTTIIALFTFLPFLTFAQTTPNVAQPRMMAGQPVNIPPQANPAPKATPSKRGRMNANNVAANGGAAQGAAKGGVAAPVTGNAAGNATGNAAGNAAGNVAGAVTGVAAAPATLVNPANSKSSCPATPPSLVSTVYPFPQTQSSPSNASARRSQTPLVDSDAPRLALK